jgi:hypothetical protein
MAFQIDDNTVFNYTVPLSPSDGNLIAVNTANGMANVLFYQTRKMTGDHVDQVDVIGAILMSITDLEKYRDAITENLENIKNREK